MLDLLGLCVVSETYFSDPSGRVAVILAVEAEDMPPPPALETEALEGSIWRTPATALSREVLGMLVREVRVLLRMDRDIWKQILRGYGMSS